MKCYNHENTDAVGICTRCGIGVCKNCSILVDEKLLCVRCKEKIDKVQAISYGEEPSDNVKKLIDNFNYYLTLSEKAIGIDTSWREGVVEHIRVIDMIRKTDNYKELIQDDYFLKAVHKTLIKWGLNQRRAKIKKFNDFKKNILKNINAIFSLKNFELEKLTDLNSIKDQVISLFDNLNVMESNAKLVSNSKTLAHFLPDLIPPMDMANILYFFYGYRSLSINAEIKKFWEMLGKFHYIQKETRLTLENHKPEGFNTSVPKMVDNAIWGFNYIEEPQTKNNKDNKSIEKEFIDKDIITDAEIILGKVSFLPLKENDSLVIKKIKEKLNSSGGKTIITLYNGKSCDIAYNTNAKGLISSKIPPKDQLIWKAFDAAVEVVINNGGKAPKGNARSGAKLGSAGLPLSSVEGYIAHKVHGVKVGETAFGPGFVIAAVLDWAGICNNNRGYLAINSNFEREYNNYKR